MTKKGKYFICPFFIPKIHISLTNLHNLNLKSGNYVRVDTTQSKSLSIILS